MSEQLRLERNLPGLLEDLYLAGTPDYRNDVLATVAQTRQRPAWTFPERWIPVVDIALRPTGFGRLPMRAISLALLLLALVAAGLIWYVGSQYTGPLPAPFGPARNGDLVYALDGDIYVGDPADGTARKIVGGESYDRKPLLSPDGTKLAFYRGTPTTGEEGLGLAVVNVDGSGLVELEDSGVIYGDQIAWAPDGSYLLRNDGAFRVLRYDIDGREPTILAHQAYIQANAFQPPKGDRVLFEDPVLGRSLWTMHADGSDVTRIYEIPAAEERDGCDFGTVHWSPDGTRIAFLRNPPGGIDSCRVHVMNADGSNPHTVTNVTGSWFETDLRWSPDGTQIAFDRWRFDTGTMAWEIEPLGLVSADGGDVRSIGPTPVSYGAAFEWSPDGRTIISVGGPATGFSTPDQAQPMRPVLIDVASGEWTEATWTISSWPTWQRLAP